MNLYYKLLYVFLSSLKHAEIFYLEYFLFTRNAHSALCFTAVNKLTLYHASKLRHHVSLGDLGSSGPYWTGWPRGAWGTGTRITLRL